MATPKLTPKQSKFVKCYLLNGGNATQAAIKAGYSKKTANEQGSQNLTKLNIKEAIAKHQQKQEDSFIFDAKKKMELLQAVMELCGKKDPEKGMLNAPSVIAAIKEHNLMRGDNAPTEINNNIRVDATLAEKLTGGSKR